MVHAHSGSDGDQDTLLAIEPESGMTVHLVKTLSVEPHGLLARLRAANRPPDPQ